MFALLFRIAVLPLLIAALPAISHAQPAFPSKPIRVIMPFPPGEGADIVLRRAAQDLSAKFGQPVVVDNRPGGNFIIGAETCIRSAPDGYTVCVINGTMMSINPFLMSKLPYDPEKDFRALTNMYFIIGGLYLNASVTVNSVKELAQYAAAKSGAMNFGTLGPGASTDIVRQWLNEQLKIDMAGIPYKGGNLIIASLAAGETQATYIGLVNALGQIRGGKARALAVTSATRSPLLPDVPTFAEAGLPKAPLPGWHGLAMPSGTPDALVKRLNADIVAMWNDPKFVEYLGTQGLDPAAGNPADFAEFMRRDREESGMFLRKFNVPRQ